MLICFLLVHLYSFPPTPPLLLPTAALGHACQSRLCAGCPIRLQALDQPCLAMPLLTPVVLPPLRTSRFVPHSDKDAGMMNLQLTAFQVPLHLVLHGACLGW